MKTRFLFHPTFLLSLLLLLLNDLWLKYEFPGLLTGKLSDFAGLFAFAFFFSGFLPKYRLSIHIITALGFVFWKSTWSEPALLWIQQYIDPQFYRVQDNTDLFALLVLPLSYMVTLSGVEGFLRNTHKKQLRLPHIPLRPVYITGISAVALFAFCSTSHHKHMYADRDYNGSELLPRYKKKEVTKNQLMEYFSKRYTARWSTNQDSIILENIVVGKDTIFETYIFVQEKKYHCNIRIDQIRATRSFYEANNNRRYYRKILEPMIYFQLDKTQIPVDSTLYRD